MSFLSLIVDFHYQLLCFSNRFSVHFLNFFQFFKRNLMHILPFWFFLSFLIMTEYQKISKKWLAGFRERDSKSYISVHGYMPVGCTYSYISNNYCNIKNMRLCRFELAFVHCVSGALSTEPLSRSTLYSCGAQYNRVSSQLEMVKTLIFSARPGPWFIFSARPVIKFLILSPFGPAKGLFDKFDFICLIVSSGNALIN